MIVYSYASDSSDVPEISGMSDESIFEVPVRICFESLPFTHMDKEPIIDSKDTCFTNAFSFLAFRLLNKKNRTIVDLDLSCFSQSFSLEKFVNYVVFYYELLLIKIKNAKGEIQFGLRKVFDNIVVKAFVLAEKSEKKIKHICLSFYFYDLKKLENKFKSRCCFGAKLKHYPANSSTYLKIFVEIIFKDWTLKLLIDSLQQLTIKILIDGCILVFVFDIKSLKRNYSSITYKNDTVKLLTGKLEGSK